jgi:hemolysin activation/secretion protein
MRLWCILRRITCLFLWQVLFVFCLHAQNFEKIAPKQPIQSSEESQKSDNTQKSSASEKVNNEELGILKGIVLVSSEDEVVKGGFVENINGVEVKNDFLRLDPKLENFLEGLIGHSFSMQTVQEINERIIKDCSAKYNAFVNAYLPEQESSNGVIQIVVGFAKLEAIKVEGNKWFPTDHFLKLMREVPGLRLNYEKVSEDVVQLNRNPFQYVSSYYEPGEEPAETVLHLNVRDRFPVRFFAGYENNGNSVTGQERWIGGFNWGDALGLGHVFSYQHTTSSDFSSFSADSASYTIPLPWKHDVEIFGGYTESKPKNAAIINPTGKSWQTSIRYIVYMPNLSPNYDHQIRIGFDFKQSNNNLEFGGTQIFTSTTDVNEWSIEYDGNLRDDWGNTSFSATYFCQPGGLTDNANNVDYQQARQQATADFMYERASVQRDIFLPMNWSTSHSFTFQRSDSNLLSSEQMSLGGETTIRGYQENEVNGDEGWYMRHEIKTPPFSFWKREFATKPDQKMQDQLVLLGFWDYGVVTNKKRLAAENQDIELSSVGCGLRYNILSYCTFYADYGFQLLDSGLNSPTNSRLHIGGIVSF